jgi:hypothetical protein
LGSVCGLLGGEEGPDGEEHRRPVAPATAAGNAGDKDLQLWLAGGWRAAVELEEGAGVPWGVGICGGEAEPAASSLETVADGVGLMPEQGGATL